MENDHLRQTRLLVGRTSHCLHHRIVEQGPCGSLSSPAEVSSRKSPVFKSKEHLGKAIEIYRECGADGWVNKAEEELAKLT